MQLTKREKEVLKYISLSAQDIAERMNLSETTVITYLRFLRVKLKASNGRMALVNALKNKLITTDELVTE